ncbi:hypothetical protein HDU93_000706 [Gonapodya sp. JEL0774]|nr:hypothetical protein HDU93_000706 [Gonapodya sp. JEL0774]
MEAANRHNKTQLPNAHTLFVEFSGSPSSISSHSTLVSTLASSRGALLYRPAHTAAEYDEIWGLRRNALWSTYELRPELPRSDVVILITDTVVPPARLAEALARTQEMKGEVGLEFQIVAHVGDGNFVSGPVRVLRCGRRVWATLGRRSSCTPPLDTVQHCDVPLKKGDPHELAKAKSFSERIARLAVEMEGSVTGEHGIGVGKRQYLEMELGAEAVEVMREVKRTFDPNGIMNPDHLIPPRHT